MKISLTWLQDFFPPDFKEEPEALAEKLTAAGLEVEEIQKTSLFSSDQVVVGEIVELQKHPQADKLTLCQLNVGKSELLPIVCGAQNHKKHDKVMVALVGAFLPGNFKIKKAKIRGEESQGMLCSEKELGSEKESAGIWILPTKTPVGMSLTEFLKTEMQDEKDVLFSLNVTPNRADCLSHYGLSRELSAILAKPLTPFKTKNISGNLKEEVSVKVKNQDLCPRYMGRSLYGVKVAPSPVWLQKRLESIGLNPINNIVDVTNYVMFDRGQPLHAFDKDLLEGQMIEVSLAQPQEKFTSLFDDELTLQGDELVIRDKQKILALAGVIGGKSSGVTSSTQNIFLESAVFGLETVRKTSRKYGIETDSSYRFTRGVDPEQTELALDKAVEMICELTGAQTTKQSIDIYPKPLKSQKISVTLSSLVERLSYTISALEFEKLMKSLNCQVKKLKDEKFEVTPPLYRQDLKLEVDLLEECARLNGYDKIPETLPTLAQSPQEMNRAFLMRKDIKEIFSEEGCLEAINYHFVEKKFQDSFLKDSSSLKDISLKNPISDQLNVMRKSLLPGLFQNMLFNLHRGNSKGRIFEAAIVFEDIEKQKDSLGVMFWGQKDNLWSQETKRPVFYDLKTSFENYFTRWNEKLFSLRSFSTPAPSFLHPSQALEVFFKGKSIGFIGTLHPLLKSEHKIREDVALAEIELVMSEEKLSSLKNTSFTPISKYPAVERDLCFLVRGHESSQAIEKEIRKQAGKLLKSIEIFDSYALEDNTQALSFRMIYQDDKATLDDEKLTGLQERIIEAVKSKLNISIR